MALDYNCEACDALRTDAPNFVVNGIGDTEVTSLANNTGLNPSSGNDDCEDLNNMNDCLVKNMETEIDSYNVCNWKDYMKLLVGNLWTMFKGIISAICGIWNNMSSISDRVDCIADAMESVTIEPYVRGFRNGDDVEFATMADKKVLQTINVYMDADMNTTEDAKNTATYGSQPADKDYIAILSWCADGKHMGSQHVFIWCSVRNASQDEEYGRLRSQHYSQTGNDQISINQTAVCYLPKGSHLIMEAYCRDGSGDGIFRIHQVSMALIPVMTIGSSPSC